jgi:hypothetical protein
LAYQRGVFWGVVPYTPAAPFSVKFMRDYEDIDTVTQLAKEFRSRDIAGELPFSVPAKLRPILCISEPSPLLRDIVALRLVNITRRRLHGHMTTEEEHEVLAAEHPFLVPLRAEVVRQLTRRGERYAVAIDVVTLNESAIATRAIGEVTEEEFTDICQRVVERLGLGEGVRSGEETTPMNDE